MGGVAEKSRQSLGLKNQQLGAALARPTGICSLSLSVRGEEGTVGGNLQPTGKGSMPGLRGGGSLLLTSALPGPALTLTQQYLDQEDAVMTTSECSIHGAGKILPRI